MIYQGENKKAISFPLGGIGTGSIGLCGNGSFMDFEVFGRPDKNSYNGYTHFAIRTECEGKRDVRVLQGDTIEGLMGMPDPKVAFAGFGFGPHSGTMAGFPHFRDVTFEGKFPMAHLTMREEDYPLVCRLSAFNPFIPHDEYNSSLPVACFVWELENVTDKEVKCALAFTFCNPAKVSHNEAFSDEGRVGVFLRNAERMTDEKEYFDFSITTDAPDADAQAYWYRGGWQDGVTMYWKNLEAGGRMPERHYDEDGKCDHATLVAHATIAPKEKKTIRFVLSWSVPNMYNYWSPFRDENGNDVTWKHYYATQFENSRASAEYTFTHFDTLLDKTAWFADALQRSSLPQEEIDAISSNLSVLHTPTVFRLTDGSLWAWEGSLEREGSCEGTCQHVWNYAYALPFLFPRLERSLRENTIKYALEESGKSIFRIALPIGMRKNTFRACLDGQMGEVIKCYREWKISGDTEWLRMYADGIFKMLEYAWSEENPDRWDADMDGVLEGRQHHTLDMELFGPSSWLEGLYLLALDCASEMAEALGESDRATRYRVLYKKGRVWMNENLFDGEYFCQKTELENKEILLSFDALEYWNDEAGEIKYQIGEGSIIDQILADYHAALIGRPSLYDDEKRMTALRSLYRYNYKTSMREVTNMWRNFAVEDERGTIICAYPEGARVPTIPIPYCEECMTGFEYALAALMVENGMIEEGHNMVSAVRERYDGKKRNPYNEIECGSNYARSMASFALLAIYSGFTYDMTKGYIGFSPKGEGCGRYFFSVGESYGEVVLTGEDTTLTIQGAPLALSSFGLAKGEMAYSLTIDGKDIPFVTDGGVMTFEKTNINKEMKVGKSK